MSPNEPHRPEAGAPTTVPDPEPGAHRRFVELLHDLGGVLWEMDARTWRFTFVSERAERLFGYPIERWYTEPTFWQDTLIYPDDREWCVGFCTVASAECRNHAFLYRARTADGDLIWIKDVVRVFADENGSPAVMRGIMVDASAEMEGRDSEVGSELDYESDDLTEYREFLRSA